MFLICDTCCSVFFCLWSCGLISETSQTELRTQDGSQAILSQTWHQTRIACLPSCDGSTRESLRHMKRKTSNTIQSWDISWDPIHFWPRSEHIFANKRVWKEDTRKIVSKFLFPKIKYHSWKCSSTRVCAKNKQTKQNNSMQNPTLNSS